MSTAEQRAQKRQAIVASVAASIAEHILAEHARGVPLSVCYAALDRAAPRCREQIEHALCILFDPAHGPTDADGRAVPH